MQVDKATEASTLRMSWELRKYMFAAIYHRDMSFVLILKAAVNIFPATDYKARIKEISSIILQVY